MAYWEVDTDKGWVQYSVENCTFLEGERAAGHANCKLKISKWEYTIDLRLLTQTNDSTQKQRNVRRRDTTQVVLSSLGCAIFQMGNSAQTKPCLKQILSDDPKWLRIEGRIQESLPWHYITELSEIFNDGLKLRFHLMQFEMESRGAPSVVQKDVFHSTSKAEVIELICGGNSSAGGFDGRLSKGSYGTAAYFSEHAVYGIGLRPYSVNQSNGHMTFLVANILLGHCKDYGNHTNPSLKRGPPLPGVGAMEGIHDSVQGTEGNYGLNPSKRQDQLWGMAHAFPRDKKGTTEYGRQYAVFEPRQSIPTFKVTVKCRKHFSLWDDVVYTKRQPSAGNSSRWYAFKGRHYYRVDSLNTCARSHGTLGGMDVHGHPMGDVDAVAYSGEGQGNTHFYIFKENHYYRYTHLCDNHDGHPGEIGGKDHEGYPMANIDGATYTRGVYSSNWYLVKGRRYFRYKSLCDNHDQHPGTLHASIDGIHGLECTGGCEGHSKWYILGAGRHAPCFVAAQYLRLPELNCKPASAGSLAAPVPV
jgi:hypothetical protein